MAQNLPPHTTVVYKKIDVKFDFYPPSIGSGSAGEELRVPVVVYFHGGGLTVGNRESWFPYWLHKRSVNLGFAFISVDYQLLPPATGHGILSDIQDFFSYIRTPGVTFRVGGGVRIRVDTDKIGVAGSSSGGLCAYLAATVIEPKPRALLSMYGMGGDVLTPYYIEPKSEVFVPGREILNPEDFKEFIHPFSLPVTTSSELQYYPDDHPTPGIPANPRMYLARLYFQLGTYLDYYTGDHAPSLSEALRNKRGEVSSSSGRERMLSPEEWGKPLIPRRHQVLFPQLSVTPDWPEVFLIHGTKDYQVYLHESQHLKDLLEAAGVKVTLREIEGQGHSFDYRAGAEDEFGWLFDEVGEFLKDKLGHGI
ncbi:alpha/beta-hydrolase [Macrolepiota fuliginosa MF-IS2]|uniref:Alpha/beta-hydrolase n=1 Tax=Macrolepiota fuliginosa MF-IS2 TaxID=1400762 RepID=A0A9P5XEZ3_9AGAR|nr:alpha/beta-hydrolase [Macrolepiota fuliginosa MF-IS2]